MLVALQFNTVKAFQEGSHVSAGFWPVVLVIVLIVAWVLSKVWFYAKKSEEQWREVDKSKLKVWDDEEDL
jgi:hypothetical protein